MSTQVTFVWNNHHEILTRGLWTLFSEKYQSDVKLECKGHSLWAHQLILSVFCPNLKSAFINGGSRVKMDRLVQNGGDMELLVQLLYLGTVTATPERLDMLQKAAGTLGIKDLLDAIETQREGHGLSDNVYVADQGSHEPVAETPPLVKMEPIASYTETADVPIAEDQDVDSKGAVGNLSGNEVQQPLPKISVSSKYYSNGMTKVGKEFGKRRFWRNKPLLKCQHCPFKSYHMGGYKRHLRMHDKDALATSVASRELFTCAGCQACFTNKRSYKAHNCNRASYGSLKCHLCRYTSGRRCTLINHIAAVHDLNSKGEPLPIDAYWCQDCDFTCEGEEALNDHLEERHQKKLLSGKPRYNCPKCNFNTVYRFVWVRHKRVHEPAGKSFLCATCGVDLVDEESYKRHLKKHQGSVVEKPAAATSSKVLRKMSTRSLKSESTCDICGYFNTAPSKLARHRIVHTRVKRFSCPFCEKQFGYKWYLKVHVEKVHNKNRAIVDAIDTASGFPENVSAVCIPRQISGNMSQLLETDPEDCLTFRCSVCSFMFNALAEVQFHCNVSHSDRQPMTYECGLCNAGTGDFAEMVSHLRIHLVSETFPPSDVAKVEPRMAKQPTLFACSHCDLRFDSQEELKRHKRNKHYTSGTQFKCAKCNYMSMNRADVTLHLMEFHSRKAKFKQ